MLRNKVPKILNHVKSQYENNVIFNKKILEVYDGQLIKHVQDAMRQTMNPTSYQRCEPLITDVNLTRQYVEKTNRTYSKPAIRTVIGDNTIDKELLVFAESSLKLNKKFNETGCNLSLHQNAAIEIAFENGKEVVRAMNATQFTVYSDDPYDTTKPTVFIKFMGQRPKEYIQTVDQNGNILRSSIMVLKDVNIFHLYDNDTFIECDEDGTILIEQPNEYGQIPFVYCRNTDRYLIPNPDTGLYNYPILINCQLTSLNYAQKMQSHTILYGINLKNMGNLQLAPDVMWDLQQADTGDQSAPASVGTIAPSVDAEAVISTISSEMKMWLESRGLKVNSNGVATQDASSGVSKIVDESDASAIRDAKATLMAEIEADFWKLYISMREVWAKQGILVDDKRPFSTGAKISVEFAEQKPMKDFKSQLDEQKLMLDMGISTPRLALKALFPDKDDSEIELMLEEINEEKAKAVAANQEMLKAQGEEVLTDDKAEEAKEVTKKVATKEQKISKKKKGE